MCGKLIVIEGLDGCGKNTQTDLLVKYLESKNQKVKHLSFPNYNSPYSSLVKMYLNSEFGQNPEEINPYAVSSFFAIDRFTDYCKEWKEFYENDYIIVCDRYTTSNAIYQMCKLEQNSWDEYLKWLYDYEYCKLKIPKPDIVIYLKGNIEISQNLLKERYHGDTSKKDFHESNILFLEKCERAADYVSKKDGWLEVECCKSERMESVEEIHGKILKLFEGGAKWNLNFTNLSLKTKQNSIKQ